MARKFSKRDITPILTAAKEWMKTCLIGDGSMFLPDSHWTAALVDQVWLPDLENSKALARGEQKLGKVLIILGLKMRAAHIRSTSPVPRS